MKHLKLFKTAQDKEAWKNSDKYITPNVIYINENDAVEFNSNNSSMQLLSLHTFTAYPEVANKIMNIVNKYCSNYEIVSYMSIIIDANFNYEGINYVSGNALIEVYNSENETYNIIEHKLSTEELNYFKSISFIDIDGNVHKPHEMSIGMTISDTSYEISNISFNIYEGNTNIDDFSFCIRYFNMYLEYVDDDSNVHIGYITDSYDSYDPNAPSPA